MQVILRKSSTVKIYEIFQEHVKTSAAAEIDKFHSIVAFFVFHLLERESAPEEKKKKAEKRDFFGSRRIVSRWGKRMYRIAY